MRYIYEGAVCCGVKWSGVEWSGVEWSGVEWSGVEWSGVEWSGVEWSGVESCSGVMSKERGTLLTFCRTLIMDLLEPEIA